VIRLVLFLSLLPASAFAQADYTARYQIRFGPLRVAEAILQANETGDSYAAAGRVTSAGLAGAFREIRFDLASEGLIEASGLRPLAYREDVNTGRRLSEVALGYENGFPTILHALSLTDPGPWALDPARQSDTIDPMSALYMIARPRGFDALCDWSILVFDGVRRSSITLGPVVLGGEVARCAGAYRRLAGFSPEDLDERQVFAFNAEFSQMEDGAWRLTRVETQTLYGRVRLLLVD
jgi:hypothetical protein